jgi:hypothetical protein
MRIKFMSEVANWQDIPIRFWNALKEIELFLF